MRPIPLLIFGFLAFGFASLATSHSVVAGEYYDDGYGTRGVVSYSSNCCYRKVVKYVRKVSYVRVDEGYRHGYYARPARTSYYGTPYRTVAYGETYRGASYYDRPYQYSGGEYYGGTSAYRVGYGERYGDNCTVRRVRVAGPYGGWVWGRTRVCY